MTTVARCMSCESVAGNFKPLITLTPTVQPVAYAGFSYRGWHQLIEGYINTIILNFVNFFRFYPLKCCGYSTSGLTDMGWHVYPVTHPKYATASNQFIIKSSFGWPIWKKTKADSKKTTSSDADDFGFIKIKLAIKYCTKITIVGDFFDNIWAKWNR